MGLLAPLYALAALAIAAPIVFHLIRRQPTGQSEFSSLMFLQQSPPRLTRRSRLDNIWLLLLRIAALALIALAFARPFLRTTATTDPQFTGRQILLILDTSGSMQRAGIWTKAQKLATDFVDSLSEADRVALATVDSEFHIEVPFSADAQSNDQAKLAAARQSIKSSIAQLKPSWRKTLLAEQLIAATEFVQQRDDASNAKSVAAAAEIVLIGDLHESSELDQLQGFSWPENVRLDVRRVSHDRQGNARPSLMGSTENPNPINANNSKDTSQTATPDMDGVTRIRVVNNRSSQSMDFQLAWSNSDTLSSSTLSPTTAVNVQVPPGQIRIVSMPARPARADRVVLTGDDEPFDNVVYVPELVKRKERVLFLGPTLAKPEDDLFFYLKSVPLSTTTTDVMIERVPAEQVEAQLLDDSVTGVVVETPIRDDLVDPLLEFTKRGNSIVVCLARPSTSSPGSSPESTDSPNASSGTQETSSLAKLLGVDALNVTEAKPKDFALLTDIQFRHPLFAPLADAKFNDFGKIHFWSYRTLSLGPMKSGPVKLGPVDSKSSDKSKSVDESNTDELPYSILARFDGRDPALLHRSIGRGDIWFWSAGWQVTASQLALSSKFVPLMIGMLDPRGKNQEKILSYAVGEVVRFDEGDTPKLDSGTIDPSSWTEKKSSNGRVIGLVFEKPQLVTVAIGDRMQQLAIEVPEEESQLDPLDADRFEQLGALVGKTQSAEELRMEARQLQVMELESRQKLWQWLLVAALAFLAIETLVSGRLQSRV